jgi:hypothetical protein
MLFVGGRGSIMKSVIGAVVLASALVSWQLDALATDIESQPLTRVACDKAGLAWNDHANVCHWQPQEQLASELITGSISSSQPLTRVACDKAGLAWNDHANVCHWQPAELTAHSSPTVVIASKPQRATKQSARLNGRTKREFTHRPSRPTQVVESRLFPLFQRFGN